MGVGEWEGLKGKFSNRQVETFGGDGYVHYFDCGDGFRGANIS